MVDELLRLELQAVERALAQRAIEEPSSELRRRVLHDVQVAMLAQRQKTERLRDTWQFAAAVATVVLFWMNLSMSATQATDFGFRRGMSAEPTESIETMTQQIQQLAPEFTPEEARRQAVLMQAGSNMIPMPGPSREPTIHE
jgi:hypothetical protein